MGVFVYADESGHSGKKIFNEGPQAYLQGSIISLGDADPILSEVVAHHCQNLGVPRLHSNEHPEHIVAKICDDLLNALEKLLGNFSYALYTNHT
ncbi:hypothetical protein [Rosenbergiella metrosideri]|uniref:hypothetical protein n=2 Tax=Rosenbergiella TaxID=1356488 RepID=UPI001F4FE697|nr:hypothetical protein [Rosenbergiella metrosideri]